MRDSDRREFGETLRALLEIHGRTATAAVLSLWWQALLQYDLAEVQAAMSAYLADPVAGRYPPVPAAVLAKLVRSDGRPGPDEAWAIAVTARDEGETVCWTAEIAEAAGVSGPIMALGDKIGARKAFLEAYARLVDGARQAGRPVAWSLSLGQDPARRAEAARRAVERGLMAPERVQHLLPQPEAAGPIADLARMLTGKVVAHPAKASGEYRQRMAELRAALVGSGAGPREDVAVTGLSEGDRAVMADLERRA